jgi:hypothetical protein
MGSPNGYDTVALTSRSMLHEKTEAEAGKILTQFEVHLKDVSLEDTIKFILKNQPGYTYEVADGAVVHIYPVGIQGRPSWPLNAKVKQFAIERQEISQTWYRKQFEQLVDPLRIDLGKMQGRDFAGCLSPRIFEGVTLRQILMELSKACRIGWVFEPLPLTEVKVRRMDWGDSFYPQGERIEARGGDWYQLYGAPVGPDSIVDGVLR